MNSFLIHRFCVQKCVYWLVESCKDHPENCCKRHKTSNSLWRRSSRHYSWVHVTMKSRNSRSNWNVAAFLVSLIDRLIRTWRSLTTACVVTTSLARYASIMLFGKHESRRAHTMWSWPPGSIFKTAVGNMGSNDCIIVAAAALMNRRPVQKAAVCFR